MILIIGLLAFFGFTAIRYRERLITGLATRWVSYRSGLGSLGDRVLIVGAGECGQMAAWLMQKSNLSTAFSIVGMVDDDPRKYKMRIDGHTVLGTTRDIPALVRQKNIGVILYAINKIGASRQEQILKTCRALPVRLVIIPDLIKIVQDYLLQPEMADKTA
jgi:FlaA1/EpsC-like NDP-sugar epimerase